MASRRNYQHQSNKADSPLRVLPVASDLVDYTLNLTDNTKHFPKKVRFTIVNRIQNCVLDIYERLDDANEIYPIVTERDRQDRIRLQKDALSSCRRLLFFVALSHRRGYIDKGTFDHWTKITLDVKYMTAAWHKAENGSLKPDPADPDPVQTTTQADAQDGSAAVEQ